jgi:hypothetical protein
MEDINAQEMETLLQRLLCDYYFILLFYYSVVDLQGTCIIQDDKLILLVSKTMHISSYCYQIPF